MSYKNEITKKLETAIASAGHGGTDKEEIVWGVVDAVSAVIDGATGGSVGGVLSGSMNAVYSTIRHKDAKSVATTPNPLFIWNGHDGSAKYTQKYLSNRSLKGIGGGVIGVAGAIASGATHVDLGGLAVHGNATGSTLAHMLKLEAIASGYRQSETIGRWIELCMKMKTAKFAIRGGQTAGAVVGRNRQRGPWRRRCRGQGRRQAHHDQGGVENVGRDSLARVPGASHQPPVEGRAGEQDRLRDLYAPGCHPHLRQVRRRPLHQGAEWLAGAQ